MVDKPVWYGPTFKRPSKNSVRKEKRQNGSKVFERDELIRLLDAAGNSDVGQLITQDLLCHLH